MPWPSQNQYRASQVQTGCVRSQFLDTGRQITVPPIPPATVHTAMKARKMSQRRWTVGSGKTRRICNRKVALTSMMVKW
jgi:hypothetical protein